MVHAAAIRVYTESVHLYTVPCDIGEMLGNGSPASLSRTSGGPLLSSDPSSQGTEGLVRSGERVLSQNPESGTPSLRHGLLEFE